MNQRKLKELLKKSKIKFPADKVKLTGPLADGSYNITFNTGEYVYQEIMLLPLLNDSGSQIIVEVDIEQ